MVDKDNEQSKDNGKLLMTMRLNKLMHQVFRVMSVSADDDEIANTNLDRTRNEVRSHKVKNAILMQVMILIK